MGGLITPLLFAVGFVPELTEYISPPEEIDINYLRNCKFLQRTPEDVDLIYQFHHPHVGNARMLLPNPVFTSLRVGANVAFTPPPPALLHPPSSASRVQSTARAHVTPPSHMEPRARTVEEDAEMIAFDHLHFQDFPVQRSQSAALRAAHEHINRLQTWNKGQDKQSSRLFGKLIRKIKKLKDQVKALQSMMSCSSSAAVQRSTAPVQAPPPPEVSEEELEHDITEDLQPPSRQPPPDNPRHSSYEPRAGKRRAREGNANPYLRRCATASRPAEPADHTTTQPTAQADHYTPQRAERGGSSSIPPYTQEGMNDEIDALIRGHR